MPNRLYQKGRRNEYRVRKILTDKGYLVFRSAGSKGPFDLMAMGKYLLAIQVKTNKGPGKPERERLLNLSVHNQCWKQIWIIHDRVKDPEIFEPDGEMVDLDYL